MTTMMRAYEILTIFKAAGTEQELSQHVSQLEEQVKRQGGVIEVSQQMGRRKLAFRISRHVDGQYHLLRFRAPTEQVGELERFLRLNDTVVRFMILSEDELAPQSPHVAAAARA